MDEREDFAHKIARDLRKAGVRTLLVFALLAVLFFATARRYHGL